MFASAPYLNPDLSTPERVADLLSRMTLADKAGQMLQLDARDGVESLINDYRVGSILHASPSRVLQAHALTEGTDLKIPLLVAEDCIHGHSFWEGATIFPTQLGMAATWDPKLLEQVARVTAKEVAATGIHWTFSPVLCITRDLRWGRVSETFGEDPFLIGELASAMVRGYQGKGLSDPTAILATAKHFAGYSETQGGRDASEADISRRKLRAWFLPPFERVAREGCRTFMLGYQTIDGVPITLNNWLLTEVLRGEWGYTGTLITDWDNVGRMVWEQQIQPDYIQASAAAVKAGNDMIMTTPKFFDGVQRAIALGMAEESLLDAAVSRILTLKFDLGLFENPRRPDPTLLSAVVGNSEHLALNLEVARKSLVLLENQGLLPLDLTGKPKKIGIFGPNADDQHTQLGDWAGASGQVDWLPDGHPREMTTTVVDGFNHAVPKDWAVKYARGANIVSLADDPAGEFFPDGQPRPKIGLPCPPDPGLKQEALALAESSDYLVAVVGDCIELVGEGRSTATLELIGGQVDLLESLAATGKPLIVVIIGSKPFVLPAAARNAHALIWAANPGMAGGQAIAELILGQIEPQGRLPVSFAEHAGQQPTFYNQIRGQHGDRYADLTQRPAYVFGQGLSYTRVEYRDLALTNGGSDLDTLGTNNGVDPSTSGTNNGVDPALSGTIGASAPVTLRMNDTLTAQITLTNAGDRPALETVQVYVHDVVTSVSWADKELKSFTQVLVPAQATITVKLQLPVAECTIVDAQEKRVVEPGEFELRVGPSSSEDSLLRTSFTVR